MSLVNTLKNLKSNLFGGPGNTGFSKPPPSKVDGIGMTKTPTSSLDSDPLRFGTYQFPKDVFENGQLGHYMVFYVNQQNRSKYAYGKVKGYNGPDAGEDLDAATNGTGLQSGANRLKLNNKYYDLILHRNNLKPIGFKFDEIEDSVWESDVSYYGQGHFNQINHIVECILNKKNPKYSVVQGIRSVKCALAAIKSAELNVPIKISG